MRVARNVVLTNLFPHCGLAPQSLLSRIVSEFLRVALCFVNNFLIDLPLPRAFFSSVVAISIRLSFLRNRPVAK
jgi:hypothetical protein